MRFGRKLRGITVRLMFSMVGVMAVVAALPMTAQAAPPPVEAYAALPIEGKPRLSPDGQALAMIAQVKGRYALVVWPLAAGKGPSAVPTDPFLPKEVWWKTPDRLVARLETYASGGSSEPTYVARAIAFDANGGNVTALVHEKYRDPTSHVAVEHLNQDQGGLVARLPDDPDHILLQIEDSEHAFPDVRRININDGGGPVVVSGRSGVWGWEADPQGVIRLASGEVRPQEGVFDTQVRDDADGAWRVVNRRNLKAGDPPFLPVAFAEDDAKTLYLRAPSKYGTLGLYRFDTVEKKITGEVAASPQGDIQAEVIDNRLVSYSDPQNLGHDLYLDRAWAADLAAVDHALPGRVNKIVDRLPNGSRVLLFSRQANSPGSYWLLDRTSGKPSLTEVETNYDQIAPEQVAPVKIVHYKARDGLEIPALLTLPVGSASGALPFVVLPHGGPYSHDGNGHFDYLAQFLASRGYGVLQPQFRGSTGFGEAFQRAGNQQWGTAIQDDISDGTAWLISQKLADPGRIAIVGLSFGGYAALNGVVREPSLYKAAVAFGAPSDLVDWRDRFRGFRQRSTMAALLGSDAAVLAASSPARHADRITVPLLLVQGRKDWVVPSSQAETMEAALKQAGKPAEVIYLPEADHFLSHVEDRAAFLTALERFLAAHL